MTSNIARAAVGAAAFIALLGASTSPNAAGNDAKFADAFAQAGMAEIGLAKIAMTKSKNPQTLAFAKRMVRDHAMADAKLATLAASNEISLPETVAPADAATKTQLENTPASAFDAAYKNANVRGHAKALKVLNMEISSGGDPKIVGYAKMQRPVVEMHAKMASRLPAS